jgi:hypothetical protein
LKFDARRKFFVKKIFLFGFALDDAPGKNILCRRRRDQMSIGTISYKNRFCFDFDKSDFLQLHLGVDKKSQLLSKRRSFYENKNPLYPSACG